MTDPYDLKRLYPVTEERVEQLIEAAITTSHTPLSPCLLPSTLVSDVLSIHKDKEALEDLLGTKEISLEIGLVFLPLEIQCLYQEHCYNFPSSSSYSSILFILYIPYLAYYSLHHHSPSSCYWISLNSSMITLTPLITSLLMLYSTMFYEVLSLSILPFSTYWSVHIYASINTTLLYL